MNFFAIGNNELEGLSDIHVKDKIKCPHCGKKHILRAGIEEDGSESDLLIYNCRGKTYLASVKGKLLFKLKEDK